MPTTTSRLRALGAALVLALLSTLTLQVAATAPASAASLITAKRVTTGSFPDPGFAKFGKYYYIYSTGTGFKVRRSTNPKGPYGPAHTSMPTIPGWVSKTAPKLWAPDVFAVRKAGGTTQYVMYFTGTNKATGHHCVGTATAASPLGPFHATTVKICADRAGYETIDPGHFVNDKGERFIVFKQDKANLYGFKIVAMRMGPGGVFPNLKAGRHVKISTGSGASARIEAPTVLRHDGKTWIFTSRGDYTNCIYATDVWAADSLWSGTFHRVKTLMTSSSTGLCGPGGATVIQDGPVTRIAFHAYAGGTPSSKSRPTWVGVLNWNMRGNPYIY